MDIVREVTDMIGVRSPPRPKGVTSSPPSPKKLPPSPGPHSKISEKYSAAMN